uniref:Secreted protein n=1 Tax=Steinernema glaseri TaxID=37863 RepID=A0A1I7YN41_9BILA
MVELVRLDAASPWCLLSTLPDLRLSTGCAVGQHEEDSHRCKRPSISDNGPTKVLFLFTGPIVEAFVFSDTVDSRSNADTGEDVGNDIVSTVSCY